jgi:microcystin-dependent protein
MPTSTKTPAKPAAAKPAARKIGAPAAAAAPYIGQVDAFAFNFAPAGWMPCDGRVLQIAQYQALFSLLGTTYGGDGIHDFALPKLAPIAPAGPHYFIAVTATAPTRG